MYRETCERSEGHSRSSFFHTPQFFFRILVLLCGVTISVPLYSKSRQGSESVAPAAFSVPEASHGFVRISGDVRHPGIYPLSANKMTIDAIMMAHPISGTAELIRNSVKLAEIENGSALQVSVVSGNVLDISKTVMSVHERLILGIPLEINRLSESDFDLIPGIGPAMAKRIVEWRHNNGGSMVVSDLLAVEGIGEIKYIRLKILFK